MRANGWKFCLNTADVWMRPCVFDTFLIECHKSNNENFERWRCVLYLKMSLFLLWGVVVYGGGVGGCVYWIRCCTVCCMWWLGTNFDAYVVVQLGSLFGSVVVVVFSRLPNVIRARGSPAHSNLNLVSHTLCRWLSLARSLSLYLSGTPVPHTESLVVTPMCRTRLRVPAQRERLKFNVLTHANFWCVCTCARAPAPPKKMQ